MVRDRPGAWREVRGVVAYCAAIVLLSLAAYAAAGRLGGEAPSAARLSPVGEWTHHPRYDPRLAEARVVVLAGQRTARGECLFASPTLPAGNPPVQAVALERDGRTCESTWQVGTLLESLPAHDPDGR